MVSAHIAVMCAERRSIGRVALYLTNVYIVVSADIAVLCAVRRSVERVTLCHIILRSGERL